MTRRFLVCVLAMTSIAATAAECALESYMPVSTEVPGVVRPDPDPPPRLPAAPGRPHPTGAVQAQDSPNALDTRLPQDDPGGAISLGTLDVTSSREGRSFKYFNSWYDKLRVNPGTPTYTSIYYRFRITSPRSRLTVRLHENPELSLYARVYAKSTGALICQSRGSRNEQFDLLLPVGEYLLHVTPGVNNRCTAGPGGMCEGELFIGAHPEPSTYDSGRSENPRNIGELPLGHAFRHSETLMNLYDREKPNASRGLSEPSRYAHATDDRDCFRFRLTQSGQLWTELRAPQELTLSIIGPPGAIYRPRAAIPLNLEPGQYLACVVAGDPAFVVFPDESTLFYELALRFHTAQ